MKRFIFFLIIIFSALNLFNLSFAFDSYGLQPLAPNGIFSTFSTESLPENNFSLEVASERSKETDYCRFSLKGAYGITDRIEFSASVPYVYNLNGAYDGLEDISLGVKHRFYDEGKHGPSLAYLLRVSVSTGRDRITSNGEYGAGIIVSKRVGPFKGHFNLFYEKPGTKRLDGDLLLSAGIELSAAHNFALLAEFTTRKKLHNTDKTVNYKQMEAGFGVRVKTTDSIYTTLGAGLDLENRSPEYRLMLSVTFLAPHEKKNIEKIYEEE